MRIRDKDLAVILHAHPVQQVPHPDLIQLFKNIVQQQERGEAFVPLQRLIFRQFQCKEQALPLPLRSHGLERQIGECEPEIVPVDAHAGSLQRQIAFQSLPQQRGKAPI